MRTTWQQRMKADRRRDRAAAGADRTSGDPLVLRSGSRGRRPQQRVALKLQMAGVRFLFAVTLGHPERVAWIQWPRHHAPLPTVLSGEEIPHES